MKKIVFLFLILSLKGDCFSDQSVSPQKTDVSVELRKVAIIYGDMYGGKTPSCECICSDELLLILLKNAIETKRPFVKKIDYVDSLAGEYEKRFNRRVHYRPRNISMWYIGSSFKYAIENNAPYPENYEYTASSSLLFEYTMRTGRKTIPAWLRESSEDAKIDYLVYANKRGNPITFLTEEGEDSIKITLENVIYLNEKSFGREMTELEKAMTEYKIQFGKQIPFNKCSDDTLLMVVRRAIKINKNLSNSISEVDVAKAVYENKFNRPPYHASYLMNDKELNAVLRQAVRTGVIPYTDRTGVITRFEITKAVYKEHFNRPIPDCKYSDKTLFAMLINALRTNTPYNENTKITDLDKLIAEYETHFNWPIWPKNLQLPVPELQKKIQSAIKSGYVDGLSSHYSESRYYDDIWH